MDRLHRKLDAAEKTIKVLRNKLKEMEEKAEKEAISSSHAERMIARQQQRFEYIAGDSTLEYKGKLYTGWELVDFLKKKVY